MWRKALTLRLLALAILWSVIVLVIAGLALTAAYRETAENEFAKRLESSLLNLVAATNFNSDASLVSEPELADPQFRAALSGWYWQIEHTATGRIIARSQSLAGETLVMPDTYHVPLDSNFRRRAIIDAPRGEHVSALEQRIVAGQQETDITLILTGSRADLEAGIDAFRQQIIFYLSLFGFGLIAITMALAAFHQQWHLRRCRHLRALGRRRGSSRTIGHGCAG